jgi:hypothetical protein
MRAFTFTLLALATIPALSQTAQSKTSNALLEETLIQSGTASQFEPAHKDYCTAVVKGGAPACLVFSTATFGAIQVLLWLDGPPAAQVGKPGGDQCLSVAAEGIQGYVYDAKF